VEAVLQRKPFEWDGFEVGEAIAPSTISITQEMVDRYMASLDQQHPWFMGASPFGGPIVPPTLLATYLGQRIFSNLFDAPRGTALHARQSMQFLAPQRVGQNYVVDGVISAKFEKRGKRYMGIDAEIRDADGKPVLRGSYLRMSTFVPGVAREARPAGEEREVLPSRAGRGGPVSPEWEIGEEIAPVAKLMSAEKISVYSGGGKNFHNDPEIAKSFGLTRPAGMALMSNAYVSELAFNFFGERWLTAGTMALAFIATTHDGDLLITRGVVRGREPQGDGELWTLEVWVEKQSGARTTVGTVTCLL
jgi:acyl dehydratase